MKKLSDFKHGEEIKFRTRYMDGLWTGTVNHYKMPSDRVFYSVHCKAGKGEAHFIQSEITEIL